MTGARALRTVFRYCRSWFFVDRRGAVRARHLPSGSDEVFADFDGPPHVLAPALDLASDDLRWNVSKVV